MNFNKNNIDLLIDNFVSTKVLDKGITCNTIIAYKKDLNLFINWCLNNKIDFFEVTKKRTKNLHQIFKRKKN